MAAREKIVDVRIHFSMDARRAKDNFVCSFRLRLDLRGKRAKKCIQVFLLVKTWLP